MSTARLPARGPDTPVQLVPPARLGDDALPTIGDFIEPIRRRWWVVLLAVIVTAAAGSVWTNFQPKEYESSATLIIGMEAPRFLGNEEEDVRVQSGPRGRFEYIQYLETQLHVLHSRPVLERVVDRLGLSDDPDFLVLDEDAAPLSPVEKREHAIEILLNRTRVVPVEGSQMVGVVVWDHSAEQSALLANSVITEYIDYSKSKQQESMSGALDWLRAQSAQLSADVDSRERALFDFRSAHTLLSGGSEENRRNTATQRVEDLGAQLTQAEVRRIRLASQWEELQELLASGQIEASKLVASDDTTQGLKSRLIALELEDAELSSSLGPNHHKVKSLRAELSYTRTRLLEEIAQLVEGLTSEVAEAKTAEEQLRDRLASQTRSAVEVTKLETEYRALQRSMENSRRLYEIVLERTKTMELASMLDTTNIVRHEPALAPDFPVRPRVRLNLALSMVLGLMLGLLGALSLEQLNQTVRDENDIEARTGIKVVGEIPTVAESKGGGKPREGDDRKGSADRFVSRFPRSQIAEAFRGLRTNLLFMRPNANFKTLLVTSAGVGEGKTSVSTNLAIALAAAGKKVCVVDTDLRRPRVHKVFDLENDEGLTLVMIGEITLDEAVVDIEENLSVLRCGPVPPNPSEQLASAAFTAIVTELKHRFDMVLFDSPPAALLSDASMLCQCTDGVLIVVRAEVTHRNLLKRAVKNLQSVNAVILGAVVNDKRKRSERGYGYGKYGYGYGYGSYMDEDSNVEATDA